MSILIATHRTAFPAVDRLGPQLARGEISPLDAAEGVCRHVEDAREDYSVGTGGLPNALGQVELDAAVMVGETLAMGAVAGIRHYAHPVSIARSLMEHCPPNFLVGEGAERFAREHGFCEAETLTPEARVAYGRWQDRGSPAWAEDILKELVPPINQPLTHDTVGCIALDDSGHLATASSTSGLAFKHPGRVGDTPLPGNGFYADDEWGAAVATGTGEHIMRFSMSFAAVELLRQGVAPLEVAQRIMRRSAQRAPSGWMGLIVVGKDGAFGAACNENEFYVSLSVGEGPAQVQTFQPI